MTIVHFPDDFEPFVTSDAEIGELVRRLWPVAGTTPPAGQVDPDDGADPAGCGRRAPNLASDAYSKG